MGKGWTPRELRHSFVSMLSADGVATEDISHLVGHSSTRTAERALSCAARRRTSPAPWASHVSLVTDSLPVQLGLDEADVKLMEGSAGVHG